MPARLERRLRAEAVRKGLSGKRANAYVFGTLRRAGWRPKRRKAG